MVEASHIRLSHLMQYHLPRGSPEVRAGSPWMPYWWFLRNQQYMYFRTVVMEKYIDTVQIDSVSENRNDSLD